MGKFAVYLLEWQSTADNRRLEILIEESRSLLERVAKRTLRRHGITDPSAVEDAISLVFDHLRRLPGSHSGDRQVALFFPGHLPRSRGSGGDAGSAYLQWLARDRAVDVVRKHRRQVRRAMPFSRLDGRAADGLWNHADPEESPSIEATEMTERCHRLHAAIGALEPRLRTVVELLLDGKSQAVIADVLDVCEGTVSRLRVRAIAELKRLMVE
jgi:RNA polymerase sigma factor (sigma-70 family)